MLARLARFVLPLALSLPFLAHAQATTQAYEPSIGQEGKDLGLCVLAAPADREMQTKPVGAGAEQFLWPVSALRLQKHILYVEEAKEPSPWRRGHRGSP